MKNTFFSFLMLAGAPAFAASFDQVHSALEKLSGCYIVDYNFTEVESLKAGYKTDERLYDTNVDKTTYELIIPIRKSATELRLQHVLFLKDIKTGQMKGILKHHAEDWSYEAPFHFDFVGPGTWNIKENVAPNTWVRKITNLDDGLRYQCEAAWDFSGHNPEWNCSNYAPIPGRETRDMGRKDYNTLDRQTRIVLYKDSFIERQNNVKTIHAADSTRTPLARELGKTWWVRQADSECAEAQAWAQSQMSYWTILMNVWEEYYSNKTSFKEKGAINGVPRFAAMMKVEAQYQEALQQNPSPSLVENIKADIRAVIESYRIKE